MMCVRTTQSLKLKAEETRSHIGARTTKAVLALLWLFSMSAEPKRHRFDKAERTVLQNVLRN